MKNSKNVMTILLVGSLVACGGYKKNAASSGTPPADKKGNPNADSTTPPATPTGSVGLTIELDITPPLAKNEKGQVKLGATYGFGTAENKPMPIKDALSGSADSVKDSKVVLTLENKTDSKPIELSPTENDFSGKSAAFDIDVTEPMDLKIAEAPGIKPEYVLSDSKTLGVPAPKFAVNLNADVKKIKAPDDFVVPPMNIDKSKETNSLPFRIYSPSASEASVKVETKDCNIEVVQKGNTVLLKFDENKDSGAVSISKASNPDLAKLDGKVDSAKIVCSANVNDGSIKTDKSIPFGYSATVKTPLPSLTVTAGEKK